MHSVSILKDYYNKLPSQPLTTRAFAACTPLMIPHIKQPDGRFQKIDFTFFEVGKYLRNQFRLRTPLGAGLRVSSVNQ